MVPSIILALLILTKVIFAYVTLVGGAIFLVYFFLSRSKNSLKFFTLLLAGFILSSPYLFYTYSLTGKYFYLSTASGLGLYWMSSKYVNEYGSCLSYTRHELHPNPEINQEHQILFNTLKPYSVVERNDILINKAIENIKNNPKNYMFNVISNVSRLIFNFPHSLRYQTLNTHWYLIFNFILMIGLFSSFYPAWINRKYLPDKMVILGVFFLIYFCGSCLVIGHSRFFLPVVPYILLWTAYIYTHYIQISFIRKQNLV